MEITTCNYICKKYCFVSRVENKKLVKRKMKFTLALYYLSTYLPYDNKYRIKECFKTYSIKIFIQSLDHFGRSHVKSCYSTLNSYHLKGDFQRHETFVSGKYANNFCKLPCGALSDIIPQAVGKKKNELNGMFIFN